MNYALIRCVVCLALFAFITILPCPAFSEEPERAAWYDREINAADSACKEAGIKLNESKRLLDEARALILRAPASDIKGREEAKNAEREALWAINANQVDHDSYCQEAKDLRRAKNSKLPITGWQNALDCAMNEVYDRATTLGGGDGKNFSDELRKEIASRFNKVSRPDKDINDVTIADLTMSKEKSTLSRSLPVNGSQFVVSVLVANHGNGYSIVSVESYLSKSGGEKDKQEDIQSFMSLSKFGEIIQSQQSKTVKRCISNKLSQ